MSTLSQFFTGGRIKSVQRGVITITGAASSATATITAVDTNKSVLSFLGSYGTTFDTRYAGRVELTNSTTVTAHRSGTSADTLVGWQVVEYE